MSVAPVCLLRWWIAMIRHEGNCWNIVTAENLDRPRSVSSAEGIICFESNGGVWRLSGPQWVIQMIKLTGWLFLFFMGANPEHRPERSEADERSNKRNARNCKWADTPPHAYRRKDSHDHKGKTGNDPYDFIKTRDIFFHFSTSFHSLTEINLLFRQSPQGSWKFWLQK